MTVREMKDSGVEWIGVMPLTWKLCRLKHYARIRNGKDYKNVFSEDGEIPVFGSGGAFTTASRALYTKVSVLLGRKGTIDKPLFVDSPFWTVDTMYYTSIFENKNPKYFYYLCTCIPFDFYQYGSAVPSMTQSDLNNVSFPAPPHHEQTAIANFLDTQCSEIDSLTADIEKQIETLQEYKKSVITEAVTKGLDPNVEMKDSGFEEVGLLPLSWTVVPFWKYFSFSRGLQITKANLVDDGVPCISYGGIHSKYTRFVNPVSDELPFVPLDYLESNKKCLLNKGDFVFADTSEDIEGSGNFSCVREQALLFAGYHTIVCRLNHVGINSNFLAYLFDSYPFRKQIQKKVNGIKVFSITQAILKSTKFWLPSLEEQSCIANFLDTQCAEIDATIEEKQKQLEVLGQYKQSLIYEYVTGKKAVPM